jgi:hypothetical protein
MNDLPKCICGKELQTYEKISGQTNSIRTAVFCLDSSCNFNSQNECVCEGKNIYNIIESISDHKKDLI